ncbi:hypothetical protein SAMN05661096_00452 [Marivirga sericea]|uniref:Uncharacterized protein n=1 Tax=Marivirga sericea TaxID=1028 RepID=A0A1X7ICN0_9BACT|nr:hypothetical protein SAMN05661096_00452 [Marivirga sericea]
MQSNFFAIETANDFGTFIYTTLLIPIYITVINASTKYNIL